MSFNQEVVKATVDGLSAQSIRQRNHSGTCEFQVRSEVVYDLVGNAECGPFPDYSAIHPINSPRVQGMFLR